MLNTNSLPPSRHSRRSLWDKIWRDEHGRVVIYQTPNAWIIAWVVLNCISLLSSSNKVENVFWWLGSAALAVWALLELFRGANYFRQTLGLLVLLITVGSAFGIGL